MRVLLAVVVMFAAAFAPALVLLVPGVDAGHVSGVSSTSALIIVASDGLSLVTAWVCVRAMMRWLDRRPMRDTGWTWNRRSFPALLLGLGLAAGTVLGVSLVVHALGGTRPVPAAGAEGPAWQVLTVATAQILLLQSVPEELVWRGYVVQTLGLPRRRAVVISAAVFAVLHLVSGGGSRTSPNGFSIWRSRSASPSSPERSSCERDRCGPRSA